MKCLFYKTTDRAEGDAFHIPNRWRHLWAGSALRLPISCLSGVWWGSSTAEQTVAAWPAGTFSPAHLYFTTLSLVLKSAVAVGHLVFFTLHYHARASVGLSYTCRLKVSGMELSHLLCDSGLNGTSVQVVKGRVWWRPQMSYSCLVFIMMLLWLMEETQIFTLIQLH